MRHTTVFLAATLGLFFGLSATSWADDKPAMGMHGKMAMGGEVSPEVRKHLSEMYQKMAECLAKTEQSVQDCQREVMKSCPVPKEVGFCPIQDGIKGMSGKHGSMKMNHSKIKD